MIDVRTFVVNFNEAVAYSMYIAWPEVATTHLGQW